MNELIGNLTKVTACIGALILLVFWGMGKVTTNEIIGLATAIGALHSGVSGITGIIGGPTQNNAISQTDVTKASRGANG
ncbi:MAG: hypothetical protein ACLPJW_17580 [Rhodomicrobium sp.]